MSMPAKTNATSKKGKANTNGKASGRLLELRLYVAGQTPKSLAALANLKKICAEHLEGRYTLYGAHIEGHPTLGEHGSVQELAWVGRAAERLWRRAAHA